MRSEAKDAEGPRGPTDLGPHAKRKLSVRVPARGPGPAGPHLQVHGASDASAYPGRHGSQQAAQWPAAEAWQQLPRA